MVVAASNRLPPSSLGIATAPLSFKRLQFVPARRRDPSPPPASGVPIVRLDVPAPRLQESDRKAEAMAREKKAALAMSNSNGNGKHAAAAAKTAAVAAAAAADLNKAKKKTKTKDKAPSSSRLPATARELFPSALLHMRWVEPLKPVRG